MIIDHTINFSDIKTFVKGKKIVLFGAGVVAKKFIKKFDKKQISFLLDNNKNLVNSELENIKIKDLSEIKKKNFLRNYFILICTTSFNEVANQLNKLGLKQSINYSFCPILNEFIEISKIENINGEILISSGLPPEKNKLLNGGGLFFCKVNKSNIINIKKIYSASVHGVFITKKNIIISDSTRALVFLNRKFQVTKKIPFHNKTRIHGIAYNEKNNSYFLVNSLQDKITEIDEKGKIISEIIISEKFKKYKSAYHHCNDILIDENSIYVSMFSFSGNHQKNIYDGGIMEFDLETKKYIGCPINNLWMPHSVKKFNGNIHILDSLKGDLRNGDKEVLGTFPGFSRGLDFDGRYYFIGQSKNRNFSKNIGNSNNISLDNSVIVFDSQNKISKSLPLNNISEIHSVNLLNSN